MSYRVIATHRRDGREWDVTVYSSYDSMDEAMGAASDYAVFYSDTLLPVVAVRVEEAVS